MWESGRELKAIKSLFFTLLLINLWESGRELKVNNCTVLLCSISPSENPVGNWKGNLVLRAKCTPMSPTSSENPLRNWKVTGTRLSSTALMLCENPLRNWKITFMYGILPCLYFSENPLRNWKANGSLSLTMSCRRENPLRNWKIQLHSEGLCYS